jgi:hypothetical protein
VKRAGICVYLRASAVSILIPAVLDIALRGKQERINHNVHRGHEGDNHKEEFAAAIDHFFVPTLCGLRVPGG